MTNGRATDHRSSERWSDGITRYQWLVLIIASLGWIFDVFEGQIFVASMKEAIPSLVTAETDAADIDYFNNVALAAFLAGGAIGGILFGMLSDRIGRKRTLSLTIIFYSAFTCLSALSQEWWHLAGMRFLVAMGVGGEWAVASAMVAEVFPKRARAHVGSIFHASSVLGTYLAVAAGYYLIGNPAVQSWALGIDVPWITKYFSPESIPWRLGFVLGALPALLIIWIRLSLREPESWQAARERAAADTSEAMGSISDLFRTPYLSRTLVGLTLAAVGLATFWGAHIYGKDLLHREVVRSWDQGVPADVLESAEATVRDKFAARVGQADGNQETLDATISHIRSQLSTDGYTAVMKAEADTREEAATQSDVKQAIDAVLSARLKRWEMIGMLLVTTGGGIGLISFGPISQRIGRRAAFLLFHTCGLLIALVAFQLLQGVTTTLFALPVFGFLTLGMHAGYAIYFPELFPTRLRATGAGFCFNGGRILAAPVLIIKGWMQGTFGLGPFDAATILSFLFLIGIVALLYAPETKGRELPE